MARKLTAKQEKYCQLRSGGKNLSDAYRGAYSTDNMKPVTVNNKAYKLEKRDDIGARIAELNKAIEDRLVKRITTSKERVIELVAQTMESCSALIPLKEKGEPVLVRDAEGNLVQAYLPVDVKGANKSQDMLMKHFGAYEKHNNQQQTNQLLVAIGGMSDGAMELLMEKLYALTGRSSGGRAVIEGTADRLS